MEVILPRGRRTGRPQTDYRRLRPAAGTRRPDQPGGPVLRGHDRGSSKPGRLVGRQRSHPSRHGIDGRLLEAGVQSPGDAIHAPRGQRPGGNPVSASMPRCGTQDDENGAGLGYREDVPRIGSRPLVTLMLRARVSAWSGQLSHPRLSPLARGST
jgi:hypothetical protein